jgi:hypothetical protein
MANRNIIEEIETKKSRSGHYHYGYHSRVTSIDDLLVRVGTTALPSDNEILRAIPVASIGMLEAHFRELYTIIINKEQQYALNALQAVKDKVKFDADYFIAIQGKKISIGDFVSHLLQINKLEDIISTISNIMGIDFSKKYKTYNYDDYLSKVAIYAKAIPEECIESVNRMFELRHIFAHELALNYIINKEQVLQDYENLKYFIAAATEMIERELGYFVGYSQFDISEYWFNAFNKEENHLEELLKKIRSIIGPDNPELNLVDDFKNFDQAIEKWKEFRTAYAETFSISYEGGSMSTSIYNSVRTQVTKYFIESLTDEYRVYLKG